MTKLFSLVIPCRNEQAHLEKCLQSLESLEYPREKFEIIVVDNGSTDLSKSIAEKYADQTVDFPNAKVGAVRNAGAQVATGDYIIFIDADCTVDSLWLIRAESLAKKNPNMVFGGGILLPEDATWVERCWLLEGPEGNSLPSELIGCSILIRSIQFKDTCGFDSFKSSGEDTDLSEKLRRNGIDIKITRELNVTHLGNAKSVFSHIKRQVWHAQSYHKIGLRKLKDPVFLLVMIYLGLIVAIVASLFFKNHTLVTLSVITVILLPVVLTAKRYYRAKRNPKNIKEMLFAYTLDFTYLTGRAVGYFTPTCL